MGARIKAQADREAYLTLVDRKRDAENRLRSLEEQRANHQEELDGLKDLVAELHSAQDEEGAIQRKLEQLEKNRREILVKETQYRSQLDEYVKTIEPAIALPFLVHKLRLELKEVLDSFKAQLGDSTGDPDFYKLCVEKIWPVLVGRGIDLRGLTQVALVQELSASDPSPTAANPFGFLEPAERQALESALRNTHGNAFPSLDLVRQDLMAGIAALPNHAKHVEELREKLAGKDYSMLKRHDTLSQELKALNQEIESLQGLLVELNRQIQHYDLAPLDEPDSRYETSCRLKAFFEEAADALLKSKKSRIEAILKDDLNKNLSAYRDVIDRAELSENLRNLSFKLYHKAGNEIYLGQLNAASKQVVIQVLLKALHESGDYDPPVMIDTVMGVLDKESRSSILQNYFPSLSHQTILLSTDSEIDPNVDWQGLLPHVSKAWTLVRHQYEQNTTVEQGYFGNTLGNALEDE